MTRGAARPVWSEAFEEFSGERIRTWAPIAGGNIGESFCIEIEGGGRAFLKHYRGCAPGIALAEARGLAWLAEARAIRVASVLAVGNDWLSLDWIDSQPPAPDYNEQLGHELAALHSAGASGFGWSQDNWIGRLPQINMQLDSWASCYSDRRIAPLKQRAEDLGLLTRPLAGRLNELIDAIPQLAHVSEPAARLHGDLWNGNILADENGAPCLLDPAVYGGHRKIDLAMMKLSGGFDASVWSAYEEAAPFEPGAEARVPLYQVYPLLVHVCLFGKSDLAQLSEALDAVMR